MSISDQEDTKRRNHASRYLLNFIDNLEAIIAKHAIVTRTKKYLIYRDGYLYTGTDKASDVNKLCKGNPDLYTYQLNKLRS